MLANILMYLAVGLGIATLFFAMRGSQAGYFAGFALSMVLLGMWFTSATLHGVLCR